MASRALSPERLDAFTDELSKTAGVELVGKLGRFMTNQVGGVGRGVMSAGELLVPGRTGKVLSRGWAQFEPLEQRTHQMLQKLRQSGTSWEEFAAKNQLPKDPREAMRLQILEESRAAQQKLPGMEAAAAESGGRLRGRPRMLGGTGGNAELKRVRSAASTGHLTQESQPLAQVWRDPKALAEELFRRGWTGQGATTKYLPVGGKSWTAGFGVGLLPGAVGKEDPYGQGRGRFERTGEHLGTQVGFVAGLPASLLGSVAASELGRRGMGGVGKGLDRLVSRQPAPPGQGA